MPRGLRAGGWAVLELTGPLKDNAENKNTQQSSNNSINVWTNLTP